jgi:hypothetical protein
MLVQLASGLHSLGCCLSAIDPALHRCSENYEKANCYGRPNATLLSPQLNQLDAPAPATISSASVQGKNRLTPVTTLRRTPTAILDDCAFPCASLVAPIPAVRHVALITCCMPWSSARLRRGLSGATRSSLVHDYQAIAHNWRTNKRQHLCSLSFHRRSPLRDETRIDQTVPRQCRQVSQLIGPQRFPQLSSDRTCWSPDSSALLRM